MGIGRKTAGLAVGCLVTTALYAGCGSNSTGSTFAPEGGAGDDVTAGGDGSSKDGPSFMTDTGGCSTSADCKSGQVCAGGVCCSDAAHVCGGTCCMGGSVCLFDQCVTPGAQCQTSDQCGMGQYCEPALGNGDAGTSAGADSGCTSVATNGRCLPLPPTCQGDAGATPDGGVCLEQCEYHPPSGGMLNAVQKWAWGPMASQFPNDADVWSTPTVARMVDTNCDGKIDHLDSPVIVFVSGNVNASCCTSPGTCRSGVLRMLDGQTGKEIWSLDKATAGSTGFMGGISLAIGDLDGDGIVDIAAMTGEGSIVIVDHTGKVTRTSDKPYAITGSGGCGDTGWGGGLAIADMDLDGAPEIGFGDTVWTTKGGALTRVFVGGKGTGGGAGQELSAFSDLDLASDNHLELVAGNTAYKADGTVLWQNANVVDGFPGVGDFDKDGKPDVAVVKSGKVWILQGATGTIELGPFTLPGTGDGGPPTVADFDGDGKPEIGVAQANYYSVVKPDYGGGAIKLLWKMQNHDYSSSVTGSTVFDFEGDGIAEVIYADECWLWVFEGPTGQVRLAWPHSSFTATEASMLADIDGDGHAEMLIPSQGVDVSANGWHCAEHEKGGAGGALNGQYWTAGPDANGSYRGLVALGDSADSWVGTRTIWSEHTYHVSNICDDSDNACGAPNKYGSIPSPETKNWTLPWLNDFRQNVQDKGIFNAPDAVVALAVDCTTPPVAHVSVRNIGQSGLPTGVEADVYMLPANAKVGTVTTTIPLLPGQTQTLDVTLSAPASAHGTYEAKIYNNPAMPKFHECNAGNDTSSQVTTSCSQ